MNLELPTCFICYEAFDLNQHLPRVLPSCGHTICSSCLSHIIKDENQLRCPIDKIAITISSSKRTVENLPVNYTLKEMLDHNLSNLELCQEHKRKKEYVCNVDKEAICHHCALLGKHVGHGVTQIEEITSELAVRAKYVEDIASKIELEHQTICNASSSVYNSLTEKISQYFNEIGQTLELKKAMLLHQALLHSVTQKTYISQNIGKSSALRTKLSKTAWDYRHPFQGGDPYALLEKDLDKTAIEKDLKNIADYAQQANENFKLYLANWHQFLNFQIQDLNKIAAPRDLAVDLRSYNLQKFSSDYAETASTPKFTVETIFTFSVVDNELFIETSDNKSVKTIETAHFGTIHKLTLKITRGQFTEHDIAVLCHVATSLESVTSINLKCCPQGQSNILFNEALCVLSLKNKDLASLIIDFEGWQTLNTKAVLLTAQAILSTMPKLVVLVLKFDNTNLDDKTLIRLAAGLHTIVKRFHTLALSFNRTNITQEGIQHLNLPLPSIKDYTFTCSNTQTAEKSLQVVVQSLEPYCQNLKTLCLNLDRTNISGKSLTRIFNKMQNLRKLAIGLDLAQISKDLYTNLGSALTANMRNLEDLELNLPRDSMDDTLMPLLVSMPRLRRLCLGLNLTQVTDKYLQAIAKKVLHSARPLKTLILMLARTSVTDDGILKLCEGLRDLNYLKLNLSKTNISDEFGLQFNNQVLPCMKSLTDFDLALNETKVTSDVVAQIRRSKDKLQQLMKEH